MSLCCIITFASRQEFFILFAISMYLSMSFLASASFVFKSSMSWTAFSLSCKVESKDVLAALMLMLTCASQSVSLSVSSLKSLKTFIICPICFRCCLTSLNRLIKLSLSIAMSCFTFSLFKMVSLSKRISPA